MIQISKKYWNKKVKHENKHFAQLLSVNLPDIKLEMAFLYIRATPSMGDTNHVAVAIENADLVMGDLNLDPMKTDGEDLKKLSVLKGNSRSRVLHAVTTTHNNQLDHIFLNKSVYPDNFITTYNNFTTDHKVIAIRLPFMGNQFSETFKKEMHFNIEKRTRTPTNKFESIKIVTEEEFQIQNVVDQYLELLNDLNQKKTVFDKDFMSNMSEKDFDQLSSNYRDWKIMNSSQVYIPALNGDQVYLIQWDAKFLTLIKETALEENLEDYQRGLHILKNIKSDYIDRLYASFSEPLPSLKFSVKTIAKCESREDVLSYFLTYIKYNIFAKTFEFPTLEVLRKETENIKREIIRQKILPLPKKRKNEEMPVSVPPKKTKRNFRSFRNPDDVSCWMNSCLQLVLAALDHSNELSNEGSDLWKLLLSLKGDDDSQTLNSLPVRDLLLEKELQRITETNVPPGQRLFHFAGTRQTKKRYLQNLSTDKGYGQQDCKDFFFCLEENQDQWRDVHQFFSFSYRRFTTCLSCKKVSRQDASTPSPHIMLECPQTDMSIRDLIKRNFNEPELVTDWRDEDGCGLLTSGHHQLKIEKLNEIQFLIIIVERLTQNNHGAMVINKSNIEMSSDIEIKEDNNMTVKFRPIAVIHHDGDVDGDDTFGHYRTDVLDVKTNKWFRTSDADEPIPITKVTSQGYIYLFKRC